MNTDLATMADAVELKKQRSIALRNFTRNETLITNLLDDASTPVVVCTPQYEKFRECWTKLEETHDAFLRVTDIDIETDKDGFDYLDAPSTRYQNILTRYSSHLKTSDADQRTKLNEKAESDRKAELDSRKQLEKETREEEERLRKQELEEKFLASKKELEYAIDTFKRTLTSVKGSLEKAEDSDKRREWTKIDQEFSELKKKLSYVVGIDSNQDTKAPRFWVTRCLRPS